MLGQAQHDEVSVRPVQTMVGVGVMVRVAALSADVVHYLVFSLTWNIGIREDHLSVWGWGGVCIRVCVWGGGGWE